MGSIVEILIAESAGDKLQSIEQAELISGKGIVGDRYFNQEGTFSEALKESGDFEVTLIESEQIIAFNQLTDLSYTAPDFRRNIVTSGINLNALVGCNFRIGNVEFKGIRLCEPCGYLAGLLGKVVMDNMVHKCGLRAIITKSGTINSNSSVRQC
jgi:hypothetical protein